METRLIMLDSPILVSDEEIKEGDILPYVMKWENGYEVFNLNNGIRESKLSRAYKIIAGIEGLPKLDLSLIAEEIGWVDVEKLAYQAAEKSFKRGINKWENKGIVKFFIDTYIEGFKAAQSLNEKKWTDDDMIDFYNFISSYPNRELKRGLTLPYYLEKFKQSRKPKEYQVECIQEGNTIKVTNIIN